VTAAPPVMSAPVKAAISRRGPPTPQPTSSTFLPGPTLSLLARKQGPTLVPISAQLEPTLPLSAQLKLTLSPAQPKLTLGSGPKVLKLSSDVSDVSRRSSS